MKKFFVIVLLLTSSVLSANAQMQTATLQQGDSVQMFYGYDALKNAVNAAQDGNTIYLSAGLFNPSDYLRKSIKIIGAGGFNADAKKNTVINGNIGIIRAEENYVDFLVLESFVVNSFETFNDKNIRLKKINIQGDLSLGSPNSSQHGVSENIEISQCRLQRVYFSGYNSNTVILNSLINGFYGITDRTSGIMISNSIIYSFFNQLESITLQNNILVGNNQQSGYPHSINNTIFTGANNFPSVLNQSGNWENVVLSDLFVNQPEDKWDASYDYHLKNPENYIGTDGTQVGIYGGLFPWNPVPSNPQIIESKVNPTTTNDGKLNFQIKAEAQQ